MLGFLAHACEILCYKYAGIGSVREHLLQACQARKAQMRSFYATEYCFCFLAVISLATKNATEALFTDTLKLLHKVTKC